MSAAAATGLVPRSFSEGGYEQDLLRQASLDPAAFAWLASRGQWQVAAHLDLLAERLLDVAQGKLKRLLIQMPPRHGKSEFASAHFPAWYLGTFPERRVILASYEHDFAASWGAKARDRFAEFGPVLWRLAVKRDKQAADDWQIAGHAGGMVCAGVGGPIMGRGADLLVIDDPVKSAEEADSETYRSRAWDWYRATAYTRLEPGGAILLIQTRWHEDDLAGRVLAEAAKTGERWEVIKLPALAEDGDVLGRAEGEPLWPERYPLRALQEIRESIGPYWWSALYQQRPAPPEGALFRSSWWRYYEVAPALDEQLISVDAAFKATDDSDYVVMQVWGRRGAEFYLLDQVRERMDFVATCQALINLSAKWPQATVKLIEDSANGPAVVSALHSKIHGIVPVKSKISGGISDGSKVGRAQAILGLVEAGNVYLPQADKAPWVAEFTAECQSFPRGVHDDQVDAMTQALLRWLWAKPAVPDAVDVAEERVRERELAELLRKHDKAWARFKPKPVVRAGTGW
jgi:predicted phage terminase large subunit-like protein